MYERRVQIFTMYAVNITIVIFTMCDIFLR